MSAAPPRDSRDSSPDQNRSVGGARQRKGPFWLEEPGWFWAIAILVLVMGLGFFLVAVGFDPP
ncbi:MAG: hypothetical protein ACRENX_06380 [Candidatus Dormibacteria bacterium]